MALYISILSLFLTFQTSFDAKVIGITDGDTIIVLSENKEQIKIRLEGIDCPESHQDFGNKAKQAVAELCFKKTVKVISSGKDRYGRMLAFVYVDNICINEKLIEMGLAWHYKKYNNNEELSKMEIMARDKKIGLWSNPNPIAPWDFRKKPKAVTN